jgi:exodeoxyribonuclease VII small subunit
MGITKKEEITIEEGFAKLNELLKKMEDGEVGLEDSFELYKEGVAMVQTLNNKLSEVEGRLVEVEDNQ